MGQVELYLGDCLEVMNKIADQSVDAIIADLPYGTTACAWDTVIPFESMWAQLKRVIKPRGAIVLFGSQPFTSALIMSNIEWFKYCWVWEKTIYGNFMNVSRQPAKLHEDIAVFSNEVSVYNPQMAKGQAYCDKARKRTAAVYSQSQSVKLKNPIINDGTRYPSSIQRFPNPNNDNVHPTQKPVDLLAYLVRTYTNEGETVLDNTMGSGTCGVACMQTGRKFVGIELKEDYFDIAVKRITDARRAAEGLPKQLRGAAEDYADSPLFAEVA